VHCLKSWECTLTVLGEERGEGDGSQQIATAGFVRLANLCGKTIVRDGLFVVRKDEEWFVRDLM